MVVIKSISHDRADETPEAKARWFQSLSLEERMNVLCSLVDLALQNNPELAERKTNAQSTQGRVRVLSAT
jgi:hypothetical protein